MPYPDGIPTHTHNGVEFAVNGDVMPSEITEATGTAGSAQIIYDLPITGADTGEQDLEADMETMKAALLGWTRLDPSFTGANSRLNRYYPLQWPGTTFGYRHASAMERLGDKSGNKTNTGGATSAINVSTTNRDWWPNRPRTFWNMKFTSLPYTRFATDAEAYASVFSQRELARFIRVREIPTPREYRLPDYGFELATPPHTPVGQIGFVPFITSDVLYTWYQVPYPDGVPWETIQDTYLRVNAVDFDSETGYTGWPAGTMLFEKVIEPDNWYFGPGGIKYVDIQYVFKYNFIGWNNYIMPNGTVIQLRRRNVTPNLPPYLSANFNLLFDPGSP